MGADIPDRISATFLDVCEEQVFACGRPATRAELGPRKGEHHLASLDYHGDLHGTVWLMAPVRMAPVLAGNVLGLDPGDVAPGALVIDAVKELLNVAAGRVIPILGGSEAALTLGTPRHEKVGLERWDELEKTAEFHGFLVEDSPVLFGIQSA